MKTSLLFLITLLILLSCTDQGSQENGNSKKENSDTITSSDSLSIPQDSVIFDKFEGPEPVVKGTIKHGAGRKILLQRMPYDKGTWTTADESVINQDGSYALQSDVSFKEFYRLLIRPGQQNERMAINLILQENETAILHAEVDDPITSYTVSGSGESEMLYSYFNDFVLPYKYSIDSITNIYPDFRSNEISAESYKKALNPIRQKKIKILDKMVQEYMGSPVAYFAQFNKISELRNAGAQVKESEVDLLDKAVNEAIGEMSQSILPTQALNNARQIRKMVIGDKGKPAPEIAMEDPNGNIRKLSDLKGKVVMIDFWASWCGPCRKQNPHVVSLYNKYHDKGFEIFSVSLDQEKDKWLQAIARDGLVWENHVSDLKGWQNEAARTYQVQSIPQVVLVDRQGNIISSNVNPEQLDFYLKDIFGA